MERRTLARGKTALQVRIENACRKWVSKARLDRTRRCHVSHTTGSDYYFVLSELASSSKVRPAKLDGNARALARHLTPDKTTTLDKGVRMKRREFFKAA